MSKCYAVAGPAAAGTATKTAITNIATSAVRPQINEVIWGVDATPADNYLLLASTRFTAAGTTAASAPTPQPLDPGDVASISTAGWTHSAEPTYATSVNLLEIAMNQRATFRWVAQDGRELVAPATAANGVGHRNVASGASLAPRASVQFRE
jgi:hypothetical protein